MEHSPSPAETPQEWVAFPPEVLERADNIDFPGKAELEAKLGFPLDPTTCLHISQHPEQTAEIIDKALNFHFVNKGELARHEATFSAADKNIFDSLNRMLGGRS